MSAVTFSPSLASPAPVAEAAPRPARLHWGVVAQTGICVVPAMALAFFGQFWPGAKYMMACLGLLLVWNLYAGRKHEAVALVLGSMPVLSFFRGFFFYYAIMVFLGAAIAVWIVKTP